jgi:hypothetical protein
LSDRNRQLADERRSLKAKKGESRENTKHYNFLCREIKRSGKTDKEAYLNEICKKVDDAHVQNKSRVVYQSVRQITEKKEMRVRAIKDKDGITITDPKKVKDRWKEHFEELYNVDNTADPTVLIDFEVSAESGDDTPSCREKKLKPPSKV